MTSPPANSLFALFFTNPIDATVHTSSISGGGLLWTKWVTEAANSCTAEAWWAYGSPSSFSATLTMSGTLTTLTAGYMVAIIVFTGALSSQATSHTKVNSALTGVPTATLTAAASDSWVIGGLVNGGNGTSPTVPAGQTTTIGGHSQIIVDSTDNFVSWVQIQSAVGNSNLTINDTAPSTSFSEVAVEILAAPVVPTGGPPLSYGHYIYQINR